MDTDVRRGADASCGQGLKDNRRVQAGETRTTDVRLDVDAPEAQLGRLPHHVHGKYFLEEKKKNQRQNIYFKSQSHRGHCRT